MLLLRLIKFIIPFLVLCLSFIPFSAKAEEKEFILSSVRIGTTFPEVVYYDFSSYLEERNLDFVISLSPTSAHSVYLYFWPSNLSSNMEIRHNPSGNFPYNLNFFNKSLENSYSNICSINLNNYDSTSKTDCFTRIDKFVSKPSGFLVNSNSFFSNSAEFFQSNNSNNSSSNANVYPFYISNESIPFNSEGSNITLINTDSTLNSSEINTKDLFYANHYDLFKTDNSTGSVDLTSVEKLLYFICFMLFAFFIFLIFKIAIRFIHMILPI